MLRWSFSLFHPGDRPTVNLSSAVGFLINNEMPSSLLPSGIHPCFSSVFSPLFSENLREDQYSRWLHHVDFLLNSHNKHHLLISSMRRHGHGCIRSFTSSTHRTPPPPIPSCDPTRSFNLNHPTLHLLETTNSRTQFKQIIVQMMKNPDLITLTFPMSRLIHFSAISHPENLDLAITLFDHFTPNPNLFIYNTIISASSASYCPSLAFRVFRDMLNRVWSDKNTVMSLVRACGCVFEAKMVHCFAIVNGFVGFDYVGNSLMKFYSDRMPERDPVAFNIMIVEYAKRGCVVEAVEVFLRMVESGVESDEFTMLGLLVCCGQSGPVRIGKLVHGWIVRRSSVSSRI
ncbi:Pentatricopeptide repeat-containing protein [Drosera capensis]